MKVDIAVCTWNRAELLKQALQSFCGLRCPTDSSFRVIVIDNRSNDQTTEVIDSFRNRLDIVSTVEQQQGHTFCRNRAVEIADSDLMLWTDDDVIVDNEWLMAHVNAAADRQFSFFGGKIVPHFDPVAAEWITSNWEILKGCFAERDLGDEPIELTTKQLPYGANFSIRTEIQKRFLFDTELGRRGKNVSGEDELDLFRRILADGHKGQWVPESTLQHVIPAERATEDYVFNYFVGQGRSLVAKDKAWSKHKYRLQLSRSYEILMYKMKKMFMSSKTWVPHLIRSGLSHGQVRATR